MIQELGLHRIEENPVGSLAFKTFYEDNKGNRITREEYEIMSSEGNKKKKAKKKKERVTVPFNRQQLWWVTKEIDDNGREIVFLRYARSVPLAVWHTYPVYKGPYFSKK